jgi:hypothetical protein
MSANVSTGSMLQRLGLDVEPSPADPRAPRLCCWRPRSTAAPLQFTLPLPFTVVPFT